MTRVLIDACVLYPSVLRGILMDCAKAGAFHPFWSPRIIEEWRRAGMRNGIEAQAGIEIALLRGDWRSAEVTPEEGLEETVFLPDMDDRHVIAAAIAAEATEVLTANTQDFPIAVLAERGLTRRHPDEFLLEIALAQPELVQGAIDRVHDLAESIKGAPVNRRKMLQKSGLPRVAKWDLAMRLQD